MSDGGSCFYCGGWVEKDDVFYSEATFLIVDAPMRSAYHPRCKGESEETIRWRVIHREGRGI